MTGFFFMLFCNVHVFSVEHIEHLVMRKAHYNLIMENRIITEVKAG